MDETKTSYYQFQKQMNYPIFVGIDDSGLELELAPLLEKMRFEKVTSDHVNSPTISTQEHTKILKVQRATPKVATQIDQSHALDTYGPENITMMGSYDVYRYKNIGMLIFSNQSRLWELGLKEISSGHKEIQIIVTRFLTWALAPMGVVGFWGVPVDHGIVVMKPNEANFESIFIDVNKMKVLGVDKIKDILPGMQILRLNAILKDQIHKMTKEDLVSFLTMNTSYFSYQGLSIKIKRSIFRMAMTFDGFVYPKENFKPRQVLEKVS